MDRHEQRDGVACVFDRIIAFFVRWCFHALVGILMNVLLVPFRFCWGQTNLEVGVLPTAAMNVAKDLEENPQDSPSPREEKAHVYDANR